MSTEALTATPDVTFKSVEVKIQDGIAEILLKGPGKGNAMGPDFWSEFPKAVKTVDADDTVRAVIVTGGDKEFSYGWICQR